MLSLRMVIAVMLISCVSSLKTILVFFEVKASLDELMTYTSSTERRIIAIVDTAQGRSGGTMCLNICDENTDCLTCGLPLPQSTEKASYSLLFKGHSLLELNEVATALRQPLVDLFGAEDVGEITVDEFVSPKIIFSSISVTSTLSKVLTEKDQFIAGVNQIVERTDSVCLKVCEVEANICHTCDVMMLSTVQMDLIVVIRGRVSGDPSLSQLAADLNFVLKNTFGTGLKETSFSYTTPQLPREDVSLAPPTPQTPAPGTVSPSGTEIPQQVVVIKYQITIELSTLIENSAELAQRSTQSLGGKGGNGCTTICEVLNKIITTTCFQCNGQPVARDAAVLEAKRWEITLTGRADAAKETFSSDLDNAVRGFLNSIGGSLNSISVTATGEIIIPNDSRPSDDGLSGGSIAGIVIGCVVGVTLIIVIVYCFACKKNDVNTPDEQEVDAKNPDSV